jgi:endonuclease/exonuclease/phosphatase family metal-dependent hydrolase
VYSDELDAYVGGVHSCNGYELSIDQIFVLDPAKRIKANVYHTLDDDIVGYISDHCPVLLDFTIKK